MSLSPEDDLRRQVSRYGPYLLRGVLTPREYVNGVLDTLAETGGVYPAVVPDLWEAVPAVVRDELAATMREAVMPGFHHRVFYFGPGRPRTDEELRRDEERQTDQVRAWAEEFVRWWDRT
jgi:hypothetical protein